MTTQNPTPPPAPPTDYAVLLRLEAERNAITAQRIFMAFGHTRKGMRVAELFREVALLFQRELGRVERYDPSQR